MIDHSYHMVDYFLHKMVTDVSPTSLVRQAARNDIGDLHIFHRIGRCEITKFSGNWEELYPLYLAWYTGEKAWCWLPSANYTVGEYVEGLRDGSIKPSKELEELKTSLSEWVFRPIEIFVVTDAGLGKSLVVDGAKRLVALASLGIVPKAEDVFIYIYSSYYTHMIFAADFLKIVTGVTR